MTQHRTWTYLTHAYLDLKLSEIKGDSPLECWFYDMIQKRPDELTLKDVSHMLRQEIYLDIALPNAWRRILDDPFCGEMYDGQMVELLSRVLKTHVQERRRDLYIPFIEKATQEMNKHGWVDKEDEKEFKMSIKKFSDLFMET